MKAERRHELATNELADWIVHFPQWFKENKTTIIVGAIIVAGLIAYTIFFYSRQGQAWEQKQALTTALLEQLPGKKRPCCKAKCRGWVFRIFFLIRQEVFKPLPQRPKIRFCLLLR